MARTPETPRRPKSPPPAPKQPPKGPRVDPEDLVEEASYESFPASDPPSFSPSSRIGPPGGKQRGEPPGEDRPSDDRPRDERPPGDRR